MHTGLKIKERREALGMSQKSLADEVSRRAGRSYSQQSLAKIEGMERPSSRFLHYIIQILEEVEQGDRAAIKREVDLLPDEHLQLVKKFLESLNRTEAS